MRSPESTRLLHAGGAPPLPLLELVLLEATLVLDVALVLDVLLALDVVVVIGAPPLPVEPTSSLDRPPHAAITSAVAANQREMVLRPMTGKALPGRSRRGNQALCNALHIDPRRVHAFARADRHITEIIGNCRSFCAGPPAAIGRRAMRPLDLAVSLLASVIIAAAPARAAEPTADTPQPRPGALRLRAESATVAPFELDLDVTPGDPAALEIRRLRVALYGISPLPGLDFRLAGYSRQRQGIPGVTAHGLDVLSLRYRVDRPIALGGRLRLALDVGGTFSLVQALAADGTSPDLRPCASQSDLFATVAIAYETMIAVGVFAQAHGDPFHLGSGDDCVGQGSLWESGDAIGAVLRARPARGIEIDAAVQRERYRVTHHDHADAKSELDVTRLGDVAATIAVRIATR
jgi:hypothetical protein